MVPPLAAIPWGPAPAPAAAIAAASDGAGLIPANGVGCAAAADEDDEDDDNGDGPAWPASKDIDAADEEGSCAPAPVALLSTSSTSIDPGAFSDDAAAAAAAASACAHLLAATPSDMMITDYEDSQ